MQKQAIQIAGLIESITYFFGTENKEGECCEGISQGEFCALRTALHKENCTMQDIARSAVVTKSGATRIVSRLEDKGLANREEDPRDGRICCVKLTEEGRFLLRNIESRLIARVDAVLAEMDPHMREILAVSLKAFFQATQQQLKALDAVRETAAE
ncbi:MAG: MarR family transcriptional regulator [Smithella sp.]